MCAHVNLVSLCFTYHIKYFWNRDFVHLVSHVFWLTINLDFFVPLHTHEFHIYFKWDFQELED